MNYIVFDLEWNQPVCRRAPVINSTVLDSEIIQIGAVKLDSDLNETDGFSIVIAPEYLTEMNPDVQNVTGMTQEDIDGGVPFSEAIEQFRNWCGEDYAFCTWSGSDIAVLNQNLNVHRMDHGWLPGIYDIQKLFDLQITHENRAVSLLDALKYLNEDAYDAHDALNDAENTVTVMWNLDMSTMDSCLLNADSDGRSGYIRSDDFTAKYSSEMLAMNDWTVKTFVSPGSGRKAVCSGWVYRSIGRYVSLATDGEGLEYFVCLYLKRNKSGIYRASRKVYPMDAGFRQVYESLVQGVPA